MFGFPLRNTLARGVAALLLVSSDLHTIVAASTNSTTSGSGLLVGHARLDISPPINPSWLPFGEFDHEQLHIRAIVFENNGVRGAFVVAEIANFAENVYQNAAQLVSEYLNTSTAHVLVSVTHTHGAAPAGSGLFFTSYNYGNGPVGMQSQWANLGEAALEVVKTAASNMVPAKIGFSSGEAYLNVNRDHLNELTGRWTQFSNFSGPVDREVQVISFVNLNNTPIAIYANYPMHPVNSYLAGYPSADWPGAMCRWIEQSFNDEVTAIFVHSASGDVNPRCRRTGTNVLASIGHMPITGLEMAQEPIEQPIRNYMIPLDKADTNYVRQSFREIEAVGIVLAEEVIRIVSRTTGWDANPLIWGKMANITCPGRTHLDHAREGVSGIYAAGPDVDVMTGVLGIGSTAIATVGAEIFTRIGWRIKNESTFTNTFLATMTNGWSLSGYIADTASWPQEVFQTLGSTLMPGSCAEDNITSSLVGFISEYGQES